MNGFSLTGRLYRTLNESAMENHSDCNRLIYLAEEKENSQRAMSGWSPDVLLFLLETIPWHESMHNLTGL